jgi:ubiquinone/menaquinone biosynthesis C-methylase UbiE
MMLCSSTSAGQAGVAFDSIAEQYDDIFTRSLIGRAQRDAVWDVLRQVFRTGQRVLELNCGTGEDALFLSRMGVSVFACDASERMIAVAARRMAAEPCGAQVQLEVRATEQIGGLIDHGPYDGVLSNFSGLNCVSALEEVVRQLVPFIRPGGRLVLCLSSRVCLWETIWFLAHGQPRRAVRRWSGHATGSLGEVSVQMRYPTLRDIRKLLAPEFALRKYKGIGVTVPPSYVEHVARRHPVAFSKLQSLDTRIAEWPILRSIADHTLLVLERSTP